MDYNPWSSKNLIDRNRLKKFMQVWIDVTCMYINFGGCGYFGFRDTTKLNEIFVKKSLCTTPPEQFMTINNYFNEQKEMKSSNKVINRLKFQQPM